MICLQISIFELLNTTFKGISSTLELLWFAYKLVSLNYWIQHQLQRCITGAVVICLQISIFELLNTTWICAYWMYLLLWFAYKLVSLNYWIQLILISWNFWIVVICLQISIFELLNTTFFIHTLYIGGLWFAYKLVSLNYWIQPDLVFLSASGGCDLLTN